MGIESNSYMQDARNIVIIQRDLSDKAVIDFQLAKESLQMLNWCTHSGTKRMRSGCEISWRGNHRTSN